MLSRRYRWFSIAVLVLVLSGCASIKTSDTARTGLEQLLISSAADQALGRVDFTPIRGAKVFVEPKFLDCVDKNYILLALNQKLLANGCTLTEKADEAEVIVQVASGGVGTDKQELMFGVPSISLPPPAMIIANALAIVVPFRSTCRRPPCRPEGNGTRPGRCPPGRCARCWRPRE